MFYFFFLFFLRMQSNCKICLMAVAPLQPRFCFTIIDKNSLSLSPIMKTSLFILCQGFKSILILVLFPSHMGVSRHMQITLHSSSGLQEARQHFLIKHQSQWSYWVWESAKAQSDLHHQTDSTASSSLYSFSNIGNEALEEKLCNR